MNDGTFRQFEASGARASQCARRARIAELNDLARTAMGIASYVVQTPGIAALPLDVQSRIRERVETFRDFTRDNDPYGERDFGAFELEVRSIGFNAATRYRVYWKIDYYDRELQYHSEDPSDPSVTQRVLTIMLASEY